MILRALTEYYQRKAQELAPIGFEEKEIPFLIVIDEEGRFIQLQDTRNRNGKNKLVATSYTVPQGPGRSGAMSYATAYPLWDHYGYVVEQPKVKSAGGEPSDDEKLTALRQHRAFTEKIREIHEFAPDDTGVKAVYSFLAKQSEKEKLKSTVEWREVLKISGCNLAFKLVDHEFLVCQSRAVQRWVAASAEGSESVGVCLVTGEERPVAKLHFKIKGVWNSQMAGANLVSFNCDSFTSWNKKQGNNSPVSEQAVFEYSTALNYLLRKHCPNRFQMGETSVVCWSQTESVLEQTMPMFFNDAPKDDPDRGTKAVRMLFDSLHDGAYVEADASTRFYILGLSPNDSRIAVRFWHVGTVSEIAEHFKQWFDDIDIVKHGEPEYPPVKALLRSTALLGKDENMSPHLVGETIRAVLSGLPLPSSALQAAIRRIKAEHNVTFYRAALIKASVNRLARYKGQTEKELSVSYNPSEKRIG
ncbi:MAG: type I-C CRISPR-associated protein Cas8c/Csd1, partial [Pusillimonas sp.]|nr:type I-C CRISPR-associated protein Cas8c/Csd1 [Pusillimonas sp.]